MCIRDSLWVVVGINTRMIYLLYDDGSRSERVILNELGSCKGIIQSDGYSPYLVFMQYNQTIKNIINKKAESSILRFFVYPSLENTHNTS